MLSAVVGRGSIGVRVCRREESQLVFATPSPPALESSLKALILVKWLRPCDGRLGLGLIKGRTSGIHGFDAVAEGDEKDDGPCAIMFGDAVPPSENVDEVDVLEESNPEVLVPRARDRGSEHSDCVGSMSSGMLWELGL